MLIFGLAHSVEVDHDSALKHKRILFLEEFKRIGLALRKCIINYCSLRVLHSTEVACLLLTQRPEVQLGYIKFKQTARLQYLTRVKNLSYSLLIF